MTNKVSINYPNKPTISLQPISREAKYEMFLNRKSVRKFLDKNLSFDILSKLLYYSLGNTHFATITEEKTGKKINFSYRAYPSAGALYSIDVYLGIINVDGLGIGIYYYNTEKNALEYVKPIDKSQIIDPIIDKVGLDVNNSSVLFYLVANFWRSRKKYGERSYRYVLQESGHIGQNISLVCTTLGLGAVAIGGYYDDEANKLVNVDGVDRSVIYLLVVGINE